MQKICTLFALLGLMALGACGTTRLEAPSPGHINNGEYFIAKYPGNLPHVQDPAPPATFGPDEGDQLTYLDRDCRKQMNEQIASAVKSIGTTTLRTSIPTAILGGGGTAKGIQSVAAGAKGYGSYGAWSAGGSAAGSGLGGGIDRRLTGLRYAQGGCMNANVTEAKKQDGALKGINVVFNADAVNGKPLLQPEGERSAMPVKHTPDPTAEAPNSAPR